MAEMKIPEYKELTELQAGNVQAVAPLTGVAIVQEAPAASVNAFIVNPVASARAVTAPPFFYQAEVGIRDIGVTGVQTCALPMSPSTLRDTDALGLVMVNDRVEIPVIRIVEG